ncbi:MAG: YfhO family protein [Gaiellaceae bacterium]
MTVSESRTPAPDQPAPASRRWCGLTRRQHVAALAVFAAVTLAFFFPLVRGDTYLDVAGRQHQFYPWAAADGPSFPVLHVDQADSFYPWQVFMNRVLLDGRFPLWSPHTFGGAPFFANGQSGVLYPPRLALTYVLSPTRVHDVLLVTHLFLAGMAMLLLLRYVGLSFGASLIGGLAWMLNSFALAWQALDSYVSIEVWLPVGVLLAHIMVRRRSWPAAFGLAIAVALPFLGGNVLFAELSAAAIFALAVALAVGAARRERFTLGGNASRVVAAVALSAGLAAVVVIPTFDLATESARASLSYAELRRFALPWHALANVFTPPRDPYQFNPYDRDLFAGAAVGVLALVGLARRELFARFAAVLGIVTILFMVHTPVTFVVDHALPGLSNFKPLARAAFLLQFALAVLAAFGIEAAVGWLRSSNATRRRPSRIRFPVRTISLVLVTAVAGSIVAQEWLWKRSVMLHQPDRVRYLYPSTPLIRYLEQRPDARFLPTASSLPASTPMIYGLHSVAGYESLLPIRIQNFWRVVGQGVEPTALASHKLLYAYYPRFELSQLRPSLLARAGVQYVVTPPSTAAALSPGYQLVYRGSDGRVLRVQNALPRASLVAGCREASKALDSLRAFSLPSFDARRTVILETRYLDQAGAPCTAAAGGSPGTATVTHSSTNTLDVAIHAFRASWLVVADSWDPGWGARLDTRPVDVMPGNYTMRVVRVPAGTHRVSFTYRPRGFTAGVAVSGATVAVAILGIAVALLAGRRRLLRRQPSRAHCR